MKSHSDITALTVANNLPSIVGRFYFDCVKSGLFQVVESQHVYTELEYAFGAKWPLKRHLITKSRKATKREYERFMQCGNKEWQQLKI